METGRPHQNFLSSFPRTEVTKKSFSQETIPKSPLLFYTPVKPSFQLVKKEDGEGHTSIAKENPKATEVARINGANVYNSTCSTPIKTPFGTPSQLQTPTSKLSFLSASGHKLSVGTRGCGMNEDAFITRTPFRLLAGKNLNACLFSPSHTPQPITFLSPFDKFVSPALKGHAKRVLVMPQQLSPARRVPVKKKKSQLTMQSPFATPKSSRVDNVPFATPKSSRVANVLKTAGQNDGNMMQHHDARNVEVNYDNKNLEGSALTKRVLPFMPPQSSFATPNSSRVEHVLKAAHQNNCVSEGKVMQHQDADVKHDRAKLERLALLKRFLEMPQLSSQARRVPLRQKQKQPIKTPTPLHPKEKQQSTSTTSLSETPKTCKSGQRRGKTCQNEAGVLDAKRQAGGSHQNTTKKVQKRVPKGKGGNDTDKAKQRSVDNNKTKSARSKQHVDDSDDVKRHSEDGNLHEACDIDVVRDEAKQYHDAELGGNDTKQHDDEDGTKHHDDDLAEDGKRQFEDGRDEETQHEDSHVDASGHDDTKEHDGDGAKRYEYDNGTKQHDHDDDTDGDKQLDEDYVAKQHDHANDVKQNNLDSMKQHNDDDADVEIGGEEAECMKQDDADVDISRDDDDESGIDWAILHDDDGAKIP